MNKKTFLTMKKETCLKIKIAMRFLSLLLLLTALGLGACNQAPKGAKESRGLQFDSLQLNRTEHLFGDTAMPACNLVLNLSFASEAKEQKLRDSLNNYFMAFSLGDEFAALQPQEAIEAFAKSYAHKYRKDLEPMYIKEMEELADGQTMGAWYSYYKKIESRITRCEGILLTYRSYYEEYTGGAHGMYATSFLNLDLRTLAPVTLDDLFISDYTEELTDLLWAQLMKDNEVSTREELFDLGFASTGELTPTENFYIDNQGITFFYNVYDIAPYVMGPVTISLKRDDVAHLIGNASLWGGN